MIKNNPKDSPGSLFIIGEYLSQLQVVNLSISAQSPQLISSITLHDDSLHNKSLKISTETVSEDEKINCSSIYIDFPSISISSIQNVSQDDQSGAQVRLKGTNKSGLDKKSRIYEEETLKSLYMLSVNKKVPAEVEECYLVCNFCGMGFGDGYYERVRQDLSSQWEERASELWFCHPPHQNSTKNKNNTQKSHQNDTNCQKMGEKSPKFEKMDEKSGEKTSNGEKTDGKSGEKPSNCEKMTEKYASGEKFDKKCTIGDKSDENSKNCEKGDEISEFSENVTKMWEKMREMKLNEKLAKNKVSRTIMEIVNYPRIGTCIYGPSYLRINCGNLSNVKINQNTISCKSCKSELGFLTQHKSAQIFSHAFYISTSLTEISQTISTKSGEKSIFKRVDEKFSKKSESEMEKLCVTDGLRMIFSIMREMPNFRHNFIINSPDSHKMIQMTTWDPQALIFMLPKNYTKNVDENEAFVQMDEFLSLKLTLVGTDENFDLNDEWTLVTVPQSVLNSLQKSILKSGEIGYIIYTNLNN